MAFMTLFDGKKTFSGLASGLIMLFALAFLLSGCSYKGAVRSDYYASELKPQEKIPYRVALVQEKDFKALRFTGGSYDIALQPGLTNTIRAGLATAFDGVRLTEEAERSKEIDYLVLPFVETGGQLEETSLTLKLSFRDADTNIEIATLSRTETLREEDRKVTGQAVLMFATFLTAGAMAPVASNHSGKVQSEYLEILSGRAVERLMKDLLLGENMISMEEAAFPNQAKRLKGFTAHPGIENILEKPQKSAKPKERPSGDILPKKPRRIKAPE